MNMGVVRYNIYLFLFLFIIYNVYTLFFYEFAYFLSLYEFLTSLLKSLIALRSCFNPIFTTKNI